MIDLLTIWRDRLGKPTDLYGWLVSHTPGPGAGQIRGRASDPRLDLIELIISDDRLEAATLHLSEPLPIAELGDLGAGEEAWLPGGERTVHWNRAGHRVVAALTPDGRVARIWLGA